jgi:hypothetical protein
MNDPNLHLLEAAARLLQPLLEELVFVGGCATGLLITDPAAVGIRPTKETSTRSLRLGRTPSMRSCPTDYASSASARIKARARQSAAGDVATSSST